MHTGKRLLGTYFRVAFFGQVSSTEIMAIITTYSKSYLLVWFDFAVRPVILLISTFTAFEFSEKECMYSVTEIHIVHEVS